MNRMQKMAWFDLAVVALALTATAILVTHCVTKYGSQSLWAATGAMGLIALSGLKWILFPKNKKEKTATLDERDCVLACCRVWVVFGFSFLFLFVFGVVVWLVVGPNNSIQAGFILTLILGAYVTAMIANAVLVLIQYRADGCE